MMAVPSPSPVGISPAGLLRKRSSSCASDMWRNWAGSVTLVASGIRWEFSVWSFCGLKGLEEFDQRALVGVRQIGAEVMAAVFDEIRSVIHFQQIRHELAQFFLGRFR